MKLKSAKGNKKLSEIVDYSICSRINEIMFPLM
jgi:hypothetical protein